MGSYVITGNITLGMRAVLVDEQNKIRYCVPNHLKHEDVITKAAEHRCNKIWVAAVSRFAVEEDHIFCAYGFQKFYHPIDDATGVYVFASILGPRDRSCGTAKLHEGLAGTKEFFDRYVHAVKKYEKLELFPKILDIVDVDVDCHITNIDLPDITIPIKTKAFGILTKRIYSPLYQLSMSDRHRELFKRLWLDKTIRPYELAEEEMLSIYGENFVLDNPEFTKNSFKKFCKKVKSIAERSDSHKALWNPSAPKMRKLDLKYGNILYCLNEKRWYYIDIG
jgi:hypothetical protein